MCSMNHRVRAIIVYGDFNCPFSALASARVAAVERQGRRRIEWRAVQRSPELPPDGSPYPELIDEVAEINRLMNAGEQCDLRTSLRRCNTRLACEAYAGIGVEDQPAVREQLFAAVWQNGVDLGDAAVIGGLVAAEPDRRRASQWQQAWEMKDRPIVPMMVLADGVVSRGPNALIRLARMIDDGHAPSTTDLGGEGPCLAHLFEEPPDPG